MIYQIPRIITDVRVAMGIHSPAQPLLTIDTPADGLHEIITGCIVEAVRKVHTEAPASMLEGGHVFAQSIAWMERACQPGSCPGFTLLPPDFMRLVAFKMDDWESTVTHAITPSDPAYMLQRSRFKGLRGCHRRPVCAIVDTQPGRVLEFYSCLSTSASPSTALYLPSPSIDAYGGIDICQHCYPLVVTEIAEAAKSIINN